MTGREHDEVDTRDLGGSQGPEQGRLVGPYKLLRVVGEGGFGIVWLAERRDPMVQRVALKVIKPGMQSAAVIARFEQERQTLAIMDHPNIARVFDAGTTEDGCPYFVMEYVRGIPITEYCDSHQLSIQSRLEIMVRVCEAAHHAHMKGVIHRDFKPSNILVVESEGETPSGSIHGALPKIIDFGVAKALSHTFSGSTIVTEAGQMIGTPEYMSPEQAEIGAIDVDTRSDIYSLGVLLFELLSGELPFNPTELRRMPPRELQQTLRTVDRPAPSTRLRADRAAATAHARARGVDPDQLIRLLERELDDIVLTSLQIDRRLRYQSALHLAEDLLCHMAGRPLVHMTTRPRTWMYWIGKTIDRANLLERASLILVSANAMVITVSVASIIFLVADALLRLDLFGSYGTGELDLFGAVRMNIYGVVLCGTAALLARLFVRCRLVAALGCAALMGGCLAWSASMLVGFCPYAAGGLLDDERFRSVFAMVYVGFFSVLFFVSLFAIASILVIRRYGRVRV